MKKIKQLFGIIAIAFFFFKCAPTDVATGGSGTETVGGCVFDTNNIPIAGATVSLSISDYLDTGVVFLLQKRSVYLAETKTDSIGHYSFGLVDTGYYTVELNDGKHGGALARCTVLEEDSLFLNSTLQPTGAITGIVKQAPEAEKVIFFVFVYGCPKHTTTTDDSGNFKIANIPEGKYDLHFISRSPLYKVYQQNNVSVSSSQTTKLDSISPPQASVAIDYNDSMCVRAILDSNNLKKISVESVATTATDWPHRIVALSLQNKGLKTILPIIKNLNKLQSLDVSVNPELLKLPAELAELKYLHKFIISNIAELYSMPAIIGELDSLDTLDVSGDGLDSLPATIISKLRKLKYLKASTNLLRTFPRAVEYCPVLQYLDISNNLLTSLPEELTNCAKNLQYLNAETNKIDSIPIPLAKSLGLIFNHKFINIQHNSLCRDTVDTTDAIPLEVINWLDSFSIYSNWRSQQNCKGNYICIPGY